MQVLSRYPLINTGCLLINLVLALWVRLPRSTDNARAANAEGSPGWPWPRWLSERPPSSVLGSISVSHPRPPSSSHSFHVTGALVSLPPALSLPSWGINMRSPLHSPAHVCLSLDLGFPRWQTGWGASHPTPTTAHVKYYLSHAV